MITDRKVSYTQQTAKNDGIKSIPLNYYFMTDEQKREFKNNICRSIEPSNLKIQHHVVHAIKFLYFREIHKKNC